MKTLIPLSALVALFAFGPTLCAGEKARRPNILWITCEDMGPHLGCYGNKFATTPNLDRFAAGAFRYRTAWSNAPVCAPARTTIISGLYPTSTGSEHMRSMTRLPASMQMFVCYLRALGYYCTNKVKEDYNLEKTGKVWDDSSNKAHWKNRPPGQPFFAVVNLTVTHESQLRARPHKLVLDPNKVPLPSYHPDTPETRHDWTQYYDNIAEMDRQVGALLRELADAGLADDTIVVFFSDHGSGMPRNKRWPGDSGLHVPFILRLPVQYRDLGPRDYQPGGSTDRLISFVDLAPTMLSLAGSEPPAFMQGQAFLGPHQTPPREYLHGFRGRMDERHDLVRSVRDQRFVYLRNYLPHRTHSQQNAYMFQTPTTKVWKQLFDAGKLTTPQTHYWRTKAPEELYDLANDPDEVLNLAGAPQHQEVLKRFRQVQREHTLKIRDVGLLPEDEMQRRSAASTPYELGHDDARYPLRRILDTADLASMHGPDDAPALAKALRDDDSAVRYWAALGLLMRGRETVQARREELARCFEDKAPCVRIAAAEALGKHGDPEDAAKAVRVLSELVSLKDHGLYVSVQALNALDELGPRAVPALPAVRRAAEGAQELSPRMREYVPRLVQKLTAEWTTPK